MAGKQRCYTPGFKAEAVKLVAEQHFSAPDTADVPRPESPRDRASHGP